MTTPYSELYDVLETFEKNSNQTILTGVNKENPDEIVVINEFNKGGALPNDLENQIKGAFTNIKHFESDEDHFTIVTKYNEGMPLHNFLETYDSTASSRLNFAFEYLKKIVPYDILGNYYKAILIDENQLIVNNDELIINELLLLDETLPEPQDFTKVGKKIGLILSQIIPASLTQDDSKFNDIQSMIHNLNSDDSEFASITEVYEKFRKLYMYDMYLDDDNKSTSPVIPVPVPVPVADSNNEQVATLDKTSDVSASTEQIPSDAQDAKLESDSSITQEDQAQEELDQLFINDDDYTDDNKEKRKLSPLAIIALIAILLTGAVYGLFTLFSNGDGDKVALAPPIANFEITKLENGNAYCENKSLASEGTTIEKNHWVLEKDGTIMLESENTDLEFEIVDGTSYKITLTVTASDGQTDDYTDESQFNNKPIDTNDNSDTDDPNNTTDDKDDKSERLNTFNITYSDNATEDFEVSRSGSKSIKLDLTEKEDGFITLNDIFMDERSNISFWVMSDSITPINITITGYNNNSKIFAKKLTHTPKIINNWELVDVSVNTSLADKLVIEFKSKGTTLWIDDISVDSFK